MKFGAESFCSTQSSESFKVDAKTFLEGKGMNWETVLLGEVPQESEVR